MSSGLARALTAHVDVFAEDVDGECAAAWVYLSALAAWAGDHGLVDARLRAGALAGRAKAFEEGATPVQWLRSAIAALAVHPGTACLTDPRYSAYRDSTPGEDTVLALLDWWAHEAPSLTGDTGPASITGWQIGDLRQVVLSTRARDRDGVVYTPWEIVDHQVRSTIQSVERHHPGRGIRVLEPFCGTGHYMVRAVEHLWDWYTKQGLPAARVLDLVTTTVSGCEIDPLSAAVARLRFVAIVGHLAHRSGLTDSPRLDAIPRFVPQIAVGDTFDAGAVTADAYAERHPELAVIQNLGTPNIEWEAPWMADHTTARLEETHA